MYIIQLLGLYLLYFPLFIEDALLLGHEYYIGEGTIISLRLQLYPYFLDQI